MIKSISREDVKFTKVNVFLRDGKTEYLGCDVPAQGIIQESGQVVVFMTKEGTACVIPLDLVARVEVYVDRD